MSFISFKTICTSVYILFQMLKWMQIKSKLLFVLQITHLGFQLMTGSLLKRAQGHHCFLYSAFKGTLRGESWNGSVTKEPQLQLPCLEMLRAVSVRFTMHELATSLFLIWLTSNLRVDFWSYTLGWHLTAMTCLLTGQRRLVVMLSSWKWDILISACRVL